MSLRRIHVFESRKKAFAQDGVLQENVIIHGVRGALQPKRISLSSSEGADFANLVRRDVPFNRVVRAGDGDAFIHLAQDKKADRLMEKMAGFQTVLDELGVKVYTGRVVDFRAREHLRKAPDEGTAPLIYPCHFDNGFVRWPRLNGKKPNAIAATEATRDFMVASGSCVLTKRFTAKEERRRVVAAVFDPHRIAAPLIGFENHLNYFHADGDGLGSDLAKGLALYLNSTLFDDCFRLFSGHTQVNATDLRKMHYPTKAQLHRLGRRVKGQMPDQQVIDEILEEETGSDGKITKYKDERYNE